MLVDETGTRDPVVSGPDEAMLKYAMLSVYYASIDDQFTVTGAPSAFVPPEVSPLPLGQALAILAGDPNRLAQALWQIVRNTPIRQAGEATSRYPDEIDVYLSPADQATLDRRRVEYRTGAALVAACLRACHHDDRSLFDALREAVANDDVRGSAGFTKVVGLLYRCTPETFLEQFGSRRGAAWTRARQQIDELEREVGLGIAAYVEQLAATAAYEAFTAGQPTWRDKTRRASLTIFPVASVIRQSTGQLWTSATVTTLAHGRYEDLLSATDPANWNAGSDVIETSYYVDDPFSSEPGEPRRDDQGGVQGLVYEVAAMTWGRDRVQRGIFRNVLNVQRTLTPVPGQDHPAIDIAFSLCRSIDSDVLWDHRPGGITMNEGFMRVVPLGGDHWRVTSRKMLRFSDRTPNSGTNGWTDFGQLLNYLAPAALSWWVETETYSLGQRAAAGASPPTDSNEDGRDE